MDSSSDKKLPSTLTVLEKALELHVICSKVVTNESFLQKRFRLCIGKPITDHSCAIHELLSVANVTDLFDFKMQKRRHDYQQKALDHVQMLISNLQCMYQVTDMGKEKMTILVQKVLEVRRLLKKWMESDQVRLSSGYKSKKGFYMDQQRKASAGSKPYERKHYSGLPNLDITGDEEYVPPTPVSREENIGVPQFQNIVQSAKEHTVITKEIPAPRTYQYKPSRFSVLKDDDDDEDEKDDPVEREPLSKEDANFLENLFKPKPKDPSTVPSSPIVIAKAPPAPVK